MHTSPLCPLRHPSCSHCRDRSRLDLRHPCTVQLRMRSTFLAPAIQSTPMTKIESWKKPSDSQRYCGSNTSSSRQIAAARARAAHTPFRHCIFTDLLDLHTYTQAFFRITLHKLDRYRARAVDSLELELDELSRYLKIFEVGRNVCKRNLLHGRCATMHEGTSCTDVHRGRARGRRCSVNHSDAVE